MPEEHTIGKK